MNIKDAIAKAKAEAASDYIDLEYGSPDIPKLLDKYDETANETAVIRNEIIGRLAEAVETIDLKINNVDPELASSRLALVDKLLHAIDSREKSMGQRINYRLKYKTNEDAKETGKAAVAVLREISLRRHGTTDKTQLEEAEREISKACAELDLEIPDTELRSDPFDFSENGISEPK